jgi:hypothetical protein
MDEGQTDSGKTFWGKRQLQDIEKEERQIDEKTVEEWQTEDKQ